MSDALLIPSALISAVFIALLVASAEPSPRSDAADALLAAGRIGPAQAELVRAGVPVDDVLAIPEECAARCTFDLGREFPLLCDCPPEVP